jgi:hypothetical protein
LAVCSWRSALKACTTPAWRRCVPSRWSNRRARLSLAPSVGAACLQSSTEGREMVELATNNSEGAGKNWFVMSEVRNVA